MQSRQAVRAVVHAQRARGALPSCSAAAVRTTALLVAHLAATFVRPGMAGLDLLVSDNWPPGWLLLPSGAAVANRLMSGNLSEARAARARYNATVFYGSIPDSHAGPAVGVFDRCASHQVWPGGGGCGGVGRPLAARLCKHSLSTRACTYMHHLAWPLQVPPERYPVTQRPLPSMAAEPGPLGGAGAPADQRRTDLGHLQVVCEAVTLVVWCAVRVAMSPHRHTE